MDATTRIQIGFVIHPPPDGVINRGESVFTTMAKTRKIGRDAGTGRFLPVEVARRRKATAVVETVKR